jgi:endonuclease/exonuclease/phosphatase family metal-dependent hydrolase
VIGGKIDISRGLPVIHLNFLGYDEQSHRRGPQSLFAHWSLKGIDDAVARLWRAANRSPWRHYDVWVYSDHGQAPVTPYRRLVGYSIEQAVTAAFDGAGASEAVGEYAGGIQTQRVRFLGGERVQRLFSVLGIDAWETDDRRPVVAALGPVGHLYLPPGLSLDARQAIARELATTHRVPVVLGRDPAGTLRAFTDAGEFRLPQDSALLFGAAHPFLDSIGADLLRLCAHPDAGDFVLLGWRDGVEPLSFATENGGHAGASPDETHAFALLPADTRLEAGERGYLRPLDLRAAALHHLGRPERIAPLPRKRSSAPRTDVLRVMTYNVHSCIGMDGKLAPERIARVIARLRPDVVALQELDVGRARTFGMDQAELIARELEMDVHFHPALHLEEERYGDAILTHLPQRLIRAGPLPGLADRPELEPRGALWVAIDLDGTEIQIVNTHLGLAPRERAAQIDALLGSEWLGSPGCRAPVVVCGDFNALPASPVCQRLGTVLQDAQRRVPGHRPRGTFFSRFPSMRIDHIYVSPAVEVAAIEVPDSELTRVASDHLPLLAELRIVRTVPAQPGHSQAGGPRGT